jgi:crossover junction endodeoxyribonuclease RuvC
MYYIGIDPGQSGAVAVLDSKHGYIDVLDWPGDEILVAKLVCAIRCQIETLKYSLVAALEDVHAMPKQGVSSTFKFGSNFGIWRGILAAYGIPFQLVKPRTWQTGIIRKADGKQASLAVARRMFPKAELHLKKHHGRADALLIAHWLRQQHNNPQAGGGNE